jgi:hypothetical protein
MSQVQLPEPAIQKVLQVQSAPMGFAAHKREVLTATSGIAAASNNT